MKAKQRLWLLVAIICSAVVTYYTMHSLLRFPDQVLHELGGDALKNYFAYIYHSTYGNGWWFDGMNYPYGEHIMFVDGQPALTIPLTYIREWVSLTPARLSILLTYLIAFAFFLAVIYVYKILLKFKVSYFLSILFASLIVVISTQNFRLFGLYGLCYACIVPMLFYWYLCYYETSRKRYMLYTLLLSCIVMFLHPYQLALVLVWTGFYIVLFWFGSSLQRREKLTHISIPFAVIVCAVILLKSVIAITDPITDRPEYPHGLLTYCTTGEDIFTSHYSPYWIWMQQKGWYKEIPFETKGFAYTGVVPIIILCIMILMVIFKLIKKQFGSIKKLSFGVSPIWIFIAIASLLFSMGIPFVWGMDWLFDYVASFRQFRSMGWFALLFYYVATIYVSVVLYSVYKKKVTDNKKGLAILLLAMPICAWVYEANGYIANINKRGEISNYNFDFFHSRLEKSWKVVLAEQGYSARDFQGIIHNPFYHVGSEKIWSYRSGYGLSLAMKASFQLQLPVVDANMSRTSWSQTFRQIKIAGGPYAYKSILHEVSDNRPYMLTRFEFEPIANPDEQYLFDNADSLGLTSNLIAYVLYPEKLKLSDKRGRDYALEVSSHMSGEDSSLRGSDFYYEHFNAGENRRTIFSQGAVLPVSGIDTLIATVDVRNWSKDILYECSAWFHVNDFDFRSPTLIAKLYDSTGNELMVHKIQSTAATDMRGMWFRPSAFFSLPAPCAYIQLRVNEHKDDIYYGLDEILIRQTTDTIISKDYSGRVMANNHLISPQ